MSNAASDPVRAAKRLERAIHAPTDYAVSISTFYRPGKPLAIKVFIHSDYSYLRSRVPSEIEGFEVLSEVSDGLHTH